jgi:hypothetical protein
VDKAHFIEVAPIWYALAIVAYLRERPSATSKIDLVQEYSMDDHEAREQWYYFENNRLFKLALDWLSSKNVIDVIAGDFGPPLIERSELFDIAIEELWAEKPSPFNQFFRHNFSSPWLREALQDLTRTQNRLRIVDADFDSLEKDWAPIPLDREEPTLQATITAVDEVTEQVRSDNGYAATYPEERKYVLDGLAAFGKHLKEAATISRPYIEKYAIDPLTKVAKRFGEAAIGVAVEVAKVRLRDWMMKAGIPWPFNW